MTKAQLKAVDDNSGIDYFAKVKVKASDVFPNIDFSSEARVEMRKHRHQDCIESDPNYIPDERVLKRALSWWFGPQTQPLGLVGETGTGKTELLLYIADKLNEPIYMIKVHKAMLPEHLEGGKELVESAKGVITSDRYGLVAKGYSQGGLIIFDEVDKGNDALHASIHGLVEGKPWPLETFSTMIHKHKDCRITATANTMGEGGHARYHSSNRMDSALRARFGWLELKYLEQNQELEIMERKFKEIPNTMSRKMIKFGNAIRDALLGPDRDGKIADPIGAIFSTRHLVNWGVNLMSFGPNATWRESLDFTFNGSVEPESRDAVDAIIDTVFSNEIDKTVSELLKIHKINR